MKRLKSVKNASTVGVVGSAANVGLEYAAVRYFGGRAPLADLPHQAADVLAYGAVYASRYADKAKHFMEKSSSWLVSIGSFSVMALVAAETTQKLYDHGVDLGERLQWAESAALLGVLAINGVIHAAQSSAHEHNAYDHGAHVNHVHAESEWYATAALLAGSVAATAVGAPLAERVIAVAAAA
jgi:divalent metal cation (Fe/Co/Zn/Cd) transporter